MRNRCISDFKRSKNVKHPSICTTLELKLKYAGYRNAQISTFLSAYWYCLVGRMLETASLHAMLKQDRFKQSFC